MATMDEMRCAAQDRGARPFIPREFVDMVTFGQWVDVSKAERELGLSAPTPLPVTLRKACNWYERFRYIPPRPSGSDHTVAAPASKRPRAWSTAAQKSASQ